MNNKIGDAKLAQKIIGANADLDGLTHEECAATGLDKNRCEDLILALGHKNSNDKSWAISKDERKRLSDSGFSKKFISKLAGTDGMRALKARVKWLGNVVRNKGTYNYEARAKTCIALSETLGAQKYSVPILINALNDSVAEVRDCAAQALGVIGPAAKKPIYALIVALRDISKNVRYSAKKALSKIGTAAIPALIAMMKDDDKKNVRSDAAWTLGKIGPAAKEAIPALIVALKDSDEFMGLEASQALSEIGTAAVPALIDALKDNNGDVRGHAAYALGDIGPAAKEAIPALIVALKDNDEEVRRKTARALGLIGPAAKEAVPALIVTLLRDYNTEVRVNAALALGEIGPVAKEAVPALIEMLKDSDEYVRRTTTRAIEKIEGSK